MLDLLRKCNKNNNNVAGFFFINSFCGLINSLKSETWNRILGIVFDSF